MPKSPQNGAAIGDIAAMVRAIGGIAHASNRAAAQGHPTSDGGVSEADGSRSALKRQVIADFCRLIGARIKQANGGGGDPGLAAGGMKISSVESTNSPDSSEAFPHLSPRMRQTLSYLLQGDGEKQIARKMAVSQHTVHVYVKALYRGFGVNTRGELLARFVATGASFGATEPPEASSRRAIA